MPKITAQPLTQDAFQEFGDVIEIREDAQNFPINDGMTQRYHDLGTAIALGEEARTAISMARAQPFSLPLQVSMVERHPLGSQAFIPVQNTRLMVVVAPDNKGTPGTPLAFIAKPGQGINYFVGTWHGVLTVLDEQADFIVVDRLGVGENLEKFHYAAPWEIDLA